MRSRVLTLLLISLSVAVAAVLAPGPPGPALADGNAVPLAAPATHTRPLLPPHQPFENILPDTKIARTNSIELPADVDGSCVVDVVDIELVAACWDQTTTGETSYLDTNHDGTIDVVDVQYVASRWGQSCMNPDWLRYLNTLRGLANLPPVTENHAWSEGAWLHSRYMVKNDVIDHSEDPDNPWYTQKGAEAAARSNVLVSWTTQRTDEQAINRWMSGPFHQVGIIDPRLRQTGYGSYREVIGDWHMGATLDVLRGQGSIPTEIRFPIMFPAEGKTLPLTRYAGGESPDPLTSCPGYETPTGPPIVLLLSNPPNVTAYAFYRHATLIPACVFDESTYTHTDASTQRLGRGILAARHAIILMPREPLTAGAYTVSITANGITHQWSFDVEAPATILTRGPAIPLDILIEPPEPGTNQR